MHGHRKCLVNQGLHLSNHFGITDVDQGADDVTHSLMDSLDDRVSLQVVCCGGGRHDPHITQEGLRFGTHKFWMLVVYAPQRSGIPSPPVNHEGL